MASRAVQRAVSQARASRRRPHRLRGGRGARLHPRDVPRARLEEGAAHELEHTSDAGIAVEIALDHLAEDPDYYRKLRRARID